MSHRSTTTEKVSTSLIRLTREDSERHDWFVVTVTEELTRTKFGSDPEILSGSLGLKVRPVNEYALDRGVPTTFGGRFEHHVPDITRATVKVTDGYVIIEDKANRGRGLGTHLMSQVVHWLQTHAQGDAIMFPVELELGISDTQAERVRRFYARFGLRFEEDKDGRLLAVDFAREEIATYLDEQAIDRSWPEPDRDDRFQQLLAMLVERVSVAEAYYLIYLGAMSAADNKARNPINATQASNLMVKRTGERLDRVVSGDLTPKPYNRSWNTPRTQMHMALWEDVLGMGDAGFTARLAQVKFPGERINRKKTS